MPNWCNNKVKVFGDNSEQIAKVAEIFKDVVNFFKFFHLVRIRINSDSVVAPIRHKGLLLCMYLL